MKNSNSSTDLAKLEWYDYALSNAKSDPKMSNPLQEIGISADVLEEGSNLLSNARMAYNEANSSKKKRAEAYDTLVKASQALEEHYRVDKNKTQIAFLTNKPVQEKLDLNRTIPKNRLQQFEMSKTFYIALSENPVYFSNDFIGRHYPNISGIN